MVCLGNMCLDTLHKGDDDYDDDDDDDDDNINFGLEKHEYYLLFYASINIKISSFYYKGRRFSKLSAVKGRRYIF